ncbi:MAG: hypothetical protein JSR77_00490 [Planctomycetes bacterium]|nr:hypothetical protein [Planctomycetota bacterium]
MGKFFNFLLANPHLIVIFFAVTFSIVGRVLKALGEQAEKRRREQARLRAEAEALRTGQSGAFGRPAPMQVSAKEELAELAARRAGETRTTRVSPPPIQPAAAARSSGSGTGLLRVPQTRTTPPAPSAPQYKSKSQRQRQQRQAAPPPVPAMSFQKEASPISSEQPESVPASERRVLNTPVHSSRGMSRSELRRFVVLREVLGPPISMQ